MDRKKLLDKLFGRNTDNPIPSLSEIVRINKVATVSPSVNWALQGGIAPGRFYGFAGPPSAGKTMFAVSCVAKLLEAEPDSVCIWFDVEKSFTSHWVNLYLRDKDQTYIDEHILVDSRATYGEDVFDKFYDKIIPLVEEGLKVSCCVVDSVQNIIPPAEHNSDSTENFTIASLARYLPVAMRKIGLPSRDNAITWFFICQIREKIDPNIKGMDRFVIPGGNAFHHLLDCIMMMVPSGRREHKIYDANLKNADGNEIQIGHCVNVKIQNKSRVGVPNRMARFKFLYKDGIVDTHEEVAELAKNLGLLQTRGSNFYFGEEKIANGADQLNEAVKNSEDLKNKLIEKIMET